MDIISNTNHTFLCFWCPFSWLLLLSLILQSKCCRPKWYLDLTFDQNFVRIHGRRDTNRYSMGYKHPQLFSPFLPCSLLFLTRVRFPSWISTWITVWDEDDDREQSAIHESAKRKSYSDKLKYHYLFVYFPPKTKHKNRRETGWN